VEYPFDCVWADQWDIVVAFGQFIGNPSLAPTRMLTPHSSHPLFDRGRRTIRFFRRVAGKFRERRIPTRLEAWLPIVRRLPTDMGLATRRFDIAARFPFSHKSWRYCAVVRGKWIRFFVITRHGTSLPR
jgi:hypothetical protein